LKDEDSNPGTMTGKRNQQLLGERMKAMLTERGTG
jgi:hypothetical protein